MGSFLTLTPDGDELEGGGELLDTDSCGRPAGLPCCCPFMPPPPLIIWFWFVQFCRSPCELKPTSPPDKSGLR